VYHWRTKPRGQEDSKVILTDAAITNALNQTVEKIREGDLEQAQAGLAVLEFHRLMRPLKDSSKGPRQFFDPAREFEPERVHETGNHISRCIAALGLVDAKDALVEAEAAAARWGKESGEVRTPKIQT
jgi:hypothetical protein